MTALGMAAAAALLSGCAVAPSHQGGQSVTHDIANYFAREWPLMETCQAPHAVGQPGGCASGACGAGACGGGACAKPCPVGGHELPWNRPTLPDPPPAVPLEPGPPGRFFPAPTQPVFTPQGPAPVPMGMNPQAPG